MSSEMQLQITVHAGRDLAAKDANGLSDPYVKIRLFDQNENELGSRGQKNRWVTQVMQKTLNPEWGDGHGGFFPHSVWHDVLEKATKIRFFVWDKDFTKSDFMGEATLTLGEDIIAGKTYKNWISVHPRPGKKEIVSGQILVEVNWFNPLNPPDSVRSYNGRTSIVSPTAGQTRKKALSIVDRLSLSRPFSRGASHDLDASSPLPVFSEDSDRMSLMVMDDDLDHKAFEGAQVSVLMKVRNGTGIASKMLTINGTTVDASFRGTQMQHFYDRGDTEDLTHPCWHYSFQFLLPPDEYPTERDAMEIDLNVIGCSRMGNARIGGVNLSLLPAWEEQQLCSRGWYSVLDDKEESCGEVFVEIYLTLHLKSISESDMAGLDEGKLFQYQVATGIRLCARLADPGFDITSADINAKLHGSATHNEQIISLTNNIIVIDYASEIFAKMRKRFGIKTEDYVRSWDFSLEETPTPKTGAGRSGSLFLMSKDKRFLYKSIPLHEVQTLLDTFENYSNHLLTARNSILMRFVALHCFVNRVTGDNFFIGVSTNAIWSPLAQPMDEVYDLKGRAPKRDAKIQNLEKNSGVWKDNQLRRIFKLGVGQRTALLEAIAVDTTFLTDNNMMDYSLLVGIQEKDDERLSDDEELKYLEGQPYWSGHREAMFIGIIDFLSRYGAKKIAAHYLKSVLWSSEQLSTVPATEYANRYTTYMPTIFVDDAQANEEDEKDRSQFEAVEAQRKQLSSGVS